MSENDKLVSYAARFVAFAVVFSLGALFVNITKETSKGRHSNIAITIDSNSAMNTGAQETAIHLHQTALKSVNSSLKNWNRGYLAFGGLALLSTALTLVCSFFIYTNSGKASALSQSISDEKDRIAGLRIAAANERAANANRVAAEANLEIVRIKAPRTLSPLQSKDLITKALAFKGTKVDFAIDPAASVEAMGVVSQIENCLLAAEWQPVAWGGAAGTDRAGRVKVGNLNTSGVLVLWSQSAPNAVVSAAREVGDALGIPARTVGRDDSIGPVDSDAVHVIVGVKTMLEK